MKEIMRELYKAVMTLGGSADLLAPIGSYGNTMNDEDVLESLRAWNRAHSKEN